MEFDFADEIEKILYNKLVRWKSTTYFKHYFLLLYLIIYLNVSDFRKSLKLAIIDEEGNRKHVPFWCPLLDTHERDGYFIVFRDVFVYWITRILAGDIIGLPPSIKDMLRPKEHLDDKGHEFNMGDWILKPKYSLIRLYGCRKPPHILPLFICERLGFLEFIW